MKRFICPSAEDGKEEGEVWEVDGLEGDDDDGYDGDDERGEF